MHTKFKPENLKETTLRDQGVDGRIILKLILKECVSTWTGSIRVRK